jgi:transcriptional regulator with XRE-family HTH domain
MTTAQTLAALGPKIRAKREAAGITQGALGVACGTDKTTISHCEAGRRPPSLERFRQICVTLRVSADELLCLKPNRSKS